MRIERADASDPATIQACFEVVRAAQETDDPLGPPWSPRRLRGWLDYPSEPTETWTCGDETTGAVHGWVRLALPDRENRDRAHLYLAVHPSSRRRGIGTALLRHAAERAARAAAGYSLVSWDGRIPDEYLARYAEVENAMADAPHDDGEEPPVWDAARVREQMDDIRERQGRRIYTLAALHDASGEMAAVTAVEADPDNPEWGHQLITAVVRKHRGHRLGLLVKTAMLDWLAQEQPSIGRIVTGNAASNRYMISINTSLGFELLEPLGQSYELPVADALRGAGPA